MQMQEEMMYARLAAQERADQRKEQVLRETRDSQLAQQAAALEFRREMGMRQNTRQMQQLRLREQQAEQKTASAARQLLGMRRLQEDIGNGMPLEQALAKNSSDLFSDHPEKLASAMRASRAGGEPQEFTTPGGIKGVFNPLTGTPHFPPREAAELGADAFTAREIMDAQGNPMGLSAIPGRGSARLLPGSRGLRPGERVNALKALIALTQNKIDFEAKKDDKPALIKKRDAYEQELEALTMQMGERVPGKVDERVGPEEEGGEGEGDFGLPPVDMEEEGTGEELADEETDLADEEAAPAEEELDLAEDF